MTLLKIATEFRKGMLQGKGSKDWCYAVSAPLQGLLSFYGHDCSLTQGKIEKHEHFWITMADGRIIDATADQFTKPDGTKMPGVYIGIKPDWYELKRVIQ